MRIRMKRKVVTFGVAAAMMVSSLSGIAPVKVKAQMQYDPTAQGNHGIKIDTRKLPKNTEDIKYDAEQNEITAVRNVTFQLFCTVDASWEINPSAGINMAASGVSIDPVSGVVKIDKKAAGGYYTITANPENVREPKVASISLHVNASRDTAVADKITFDKSMGEDSQITLSNDNKTMTVDGKVKNKKLKLAYSPEYILDVTETFRDSGATKVFQLADDPANNVTGDNTLLTTRDRSDTVGVSLYGRIGVDAAQVEQKLTIIVKDVNLTKKLVCPETDLTNQANGAYELQLDQTVNFNLVSNERITMPECLISNVTWELKQTSNDLKPEKNANGSDRVEKLSYSAKDGVTGETVYYYDVEHKVYLVKNAESELVATIYVSDKHIYVETEKKVKTPSANVGAVLFQGKFNTTSDNAGNDASLPRLEVNFNTKGMRKSPTSVNIDFEKAGLIPGKDFVKKEKALEVDGVKQDVYYFEADGSKLNLSAATFADIKGVRSFEESKRAAFAPKQSYEMKYIFKPLADSVFGTSEVAGKYNMDISENTQMTDDGELLRNDTFNKTEKGYIQVTASCTSAGEKIGKDVVVYLRFVDPAAEALNNFKVSKNSDFWYNLDRGEVVHIRQGESTMPGDYAEEKENNVYKVRHTITDFNPFIEYEFSDVIDNGGKEIANATANDGDYRINGLEYGIVTVRAVGAVNRNVERSFTLYVNQDVLEYDFHIDFTDALAAGRVTESNEILGKQSSVPVSVVPESSGGAAPTIVDWKLSCDKSVAEISKDGIISTYKSSGGEKITVTATSKGGQMKTAEFTIREVNVTQIVTIGESPEDSPAVLTDVQNNSGTCKVGEKFKLVPVAFEPVNATVDYMSSIKWFSADVAKAVVNPDTGEVTAVAETGESPVAIIATYTAAGNASITASFNLNIKGNKAAAPGSGDSPSGTPASTNNPNNSGSSSDSTGASAVKKGSTQKISGITYRVTSASAKTVTVSGSKTAKKAAIKGTVKLRDGRKYKVTAIAANAFKNNKKLKSVVIGANIKTIGKQAFSGCKKLTKITVQSKSLKSIGAKAFAGGAKKVSVTVPKKKAAKYKKMFKKAKIGKKTKYKKK